MSFWQYMSPVSPVFHTPYCSKSDLTLDWWFNWDNKSSRGPIPDQGTWPLSTKLMEDRLRRASGHVHFQFCYIYCCKRATLKLTVQLLESFEIFLKFHLYLCCKYCLSFFATDWKMWTRSNHLTGWTICYQHIFIGLDFLNPTLRLRRWDVTSFCMQ